MKNQKILITLIVIIAIIIIVGVMVIIDMNKKEIIIPDEYTLESNKSGVLTYTNNLSNGYKLEIKEQGNPKGIKNDDRYGTLMKCEIDGKNYTVTCYIPVDDTKSLAIDSKYPDIKAHPGKEIVQGYSTYGNLDSNPIIKFSTNTPYDVETLQDMNKTGNLNSSYIKQSWPSTYMNAVDEINDLYTIESLNRLVYSWGIDI